MLIKIQGKDVIVNLDNVERIYAADSEILAQYTDSRWETMGNYKDRGRAIEVFREIVSAYDKRLVVYEMPEE